MADQKKQDSQGASDSQSSSNQRINQSGSPGPTPGSAEGDRRTVEEDLRDQRGDRQPS